MVPVSKRHRRRGSRGKSDPGADPDVTASGKAGIIVNKRTLDARTARHGTVPLTSVSESALSQYVACGREFGRGPLSSHASLEHLPPPPPLYADGRSIDPTGPMRRARRIAEPGNEGGFVPRLATSSAALTLDRLLRDVCARHSESI